MTIKIGIVGAGVWAERVHIPSIVRDSRYELVGLFSRRQSVAEALAARCDIRAVDSFDSLLDQADVIDFVVPPAAQPALALEAAQLGKHLILEKPVGLNASSLSSLVAEVVRRGLLASVFVTRYFDQQRTSLVRELATRPWTHALSTWRSNAYLPGNPFATPWRDEAAMLYDIGPHLIAQLESILGTVISGERSQHSPTALELTLRHQGGTTSRIQVDVGADVQQLEETLTLWAADAGEDGEQVALASVDPRNAFASLLGILAEDIEAGRTIPSIPDEATLAAGVRMVALLELLDGRPSH